MALNVNQFAVQQIKGVLDLAYNTTVITCTVKSDEGTALVPGQAVKLVDSAAPSPVVTTATVNTDDVFGFVVYNPKINAFAANQQVDIAVMGGTVMVMEASAAIARWAPVSIVVTGQKVVTASGALVVVGRALDKAAADADLIRVWINLPGQTYNEYQFSQAAVVAALSAWSDLTGVDGTGSNAAPLAGVNTTFSGLYTKINAILTALKAANLMASA